MRISKLFVLFWVCKEIFTSSDVVSFLNSLPPERAIEAKVVGTEMMQPFYVFYRVEKS